jgi:Flp pilus assembly protein TadG
MERKRRVGTFRVGGSARRQRGSSIIEFCLMCPWLILLFTGVFDFGFYAYSFISVRNATRVAVLHAAANATTAVDQAGACRLVTEELRSLPNLGSSFSSSCGAAPLSVTSAYCSGATACGSSSATADSGPAALVTVTYQLPPLFRMPLRGISSITQSAEVRLRDTLQ